MDESLAPSDGENLKVPAQEYDNEQSKSCFVQPSQSLR